MSKPFQDVLKSKPIESIAAELFHSEADKKGH